MKRGMLSSASTLLRPALSQGQPRASPYAAPSMEPMAISSTLIFIGSSLISQARPVQTIALSICCCPGRPGHAMTGPDSGGSRCSHGGRGGRMAGDSIIKGGGMSALEELHFRFCGVFDGIGHGDLVVKLRADIHWTLKLYLENLQPGQFHQGLFFTLKNNACDVRG